jgi:proteasome lid subunit RPN8/RPN11
MIDADIKLEIEQDAKNSFPRECCGILLNIDGKQAYHKCRNVALGHEEQDFIMEPLDYRDAEDRGEVLAIIHSHPNASEQPSEADKISCEKSGKPWFIVSYPELKWAQIDPTGIKQPLMGRSFIYGVSDCQTLFIDYYEEVLGINNIKYFPSEYEWWNNGKNYYEENWDSWTEGSFVKIKNHREMQEHDVLLLQIISPVCNHAAIYLGGNMIMHHLMGRLSTKDIYGEYFQKNTIHVLRHKSLC